MHKVEYVLTALAKIEQTVERVHCRLPRITTKKIYGVSYDK